MQWSLEDIYKKQVRGNVPSRKHLRVLGEGSFTRRKPPPNIEEMIKTADFKEINGKLHYQRRGEEGRHIPANRWTPADSEIAFEFFKYQYSLCKDDDCRNRMMTGVATSTMVGVFEDFLSSNVKRWNEKVVSRYAEDLAGLLSIHAGRGSDKIDKLREFLNDIESHPEFETHERPKGNLITDFKKVKKYNIDKGVIEQLMSHTGQDEKKRSVGKAELGMSLLFKNIGSAVGAGDLAVLVGGLENPDREGFEIKGQNAILGDQPDKHEINPAYLKPFGITKGNRKLLVKGSDKAYRVSDLAVALADVYNNVEKLKLPGIKNTTQFEEELKDLLFDRGGKYPGTHAFEEGGDVERVFNQIKWDEANSINSGIGLMNFVRYATKEDFTHFMAHDFGEVGKKYEDGTPGASEARNTGDYVYVTGSPYEMAQQLSKMGGDGTIGFQDISPGNVRPRIGLRTTTKRYTAKKLRDMGIDPATAKEEERREPPEEGRYGTDIGQIDLPDHDDDEKL